MLDLSLVPDLILRHCSMPFVNANKVWLRRDAQNFMKFAAHDVLDFIV
jgi:hypothetical protein